MRNTSFFGGIALGLAVAIVAGAGLLAFDVIEVDLRSHKNFGEIEEESDGIFSSGGLLYTVTSVREEREESRFVHFDAVVANNSSRYQEQTIPVAYCVLPGGESTAEAVHQFNPAGIHPSEGSAMGDAAVVEYRCEISEEMELHQISITLKTPKGSVFSFVDPIGSASNVRRPQGN